MDIRERIVSILKGVAAGASAAFCSIFPASAIITDLSAAKMAVVAGVSAGIAALLGGVYQLLASLWGQAGNILQDLKDPY